jgi:lipoprotein-releasing system ATP-binding protein
MNRPGNLDRHSAQTVTSLLLEIAQLHRVILIVVTHSIEVARRFPRRYELLDGRLSPLTIS